MRRYAGIIIAAISILMGLIITNSIYTDYRVLINWIPISTTIGKIVFFILSTLLFAIIIFIILFILRKHIVNFVLSIVDTINKKPRLQIIGASFGFLGGVLAATFISNLYKFIEIKALSVALAIITYVFLASIGLIIGGKVALDTRGFFESRKKSDQMDFNSFVKVIDTSAFIDGRIVNIAKTSFLEGKIIIAQFVLEELQHLADNSDDLIRAKGRRGLDLVKELQELTNINIEIIDEDFKNIDEVDLKLIKIAKKYNAGIITTDYNLNKLASLQDIVVYNVNDLSRAVKPNAIPGDIMNIEIIKKGKERKQGVGYLEDGTMVVVEETMDLIGETLPVEIVTILQTPAGKMLFGKIKE